MLHQFPEAMIMQNIIHWSREGLGVWILHFWLLIGVGMFYIIHRSS